MTPSRIAWFLGTLVLTTPIILAVMTGGRGIDGLAVLQSLAWAAGIAVVHALLWGKARRPEEGEE